MGLIFERLSEHLGAELVIRLQPQGLVQHNIHHNQILRDFNFLPYKNENSVPCGNKWLLNQGYPKKYPKKEGKAVNRL